VYKNYGTKIQIMKKIRHTTPCTEKMG